MTYPHHSPPNPPNVPPNPPTNPPTHPHPPPNIRSGLPPDQGPRSGLHPVSHHLAHPPLNPPLRLQPNPLNSPPGVPSNPPPGYLMLPIPFPVRPLFNNILNAPDNIGEMRQRFFLLERPITQSHYEHEIYWPFMDNFWVRNKVKDSADCRTEYYWCRLFRKQDQKSSIPPERRKRKCTVRSAVGCEMKLRKRFWKDGTVEISNHGTCSQHCHSMDEMDQIKRNSAVRLAIGNEIGKGYRPTEVKRVLLKNQEILAAAGGQSITIKDCHNAALTFGKESKEHSPSSKGAEQPESHESLQDDDEPMLGAMLQAHNQQEAETSEKQDFEPSTQVQAQETGQIRQASAEPASHIARSELTRDPNGKRANKRNKAVLEKQ